MIPVAIISKNAFLKKVKSFLKGKTVVLIEPESYDNDENCMDEYIYLFTEVIDLGLGEKIKVTKSLTFYKRTFIFNENTSLEPKMEVTVLAKVTVIRKRKSVTFYILI